MRTLTVVLSLLLGPSLMACDTLDSPNHGENSLRAGSYSVADTKDAYFVTGPLCPTYKCGLNSPFIGHELHLNGDLNDKQVRLLGAYHIGYGPVTVEVRGDELVALDGAGEELTREQLVGLKFNLEGEVNGEPVPLQVKLVEVAAMPMWVDTAENDTPELIPSYKFVYDAIDIEAQLLCPSPSEGELSDPAAELLAKEQTALFDAGDIQGLQALNEEQEETSLAHHAVLFAGERFDFETAEITDEGETSWFNWGCAGSSAAKLHLTGHTSAAALHMPAVEPASHDLKQTVLYAYTATYCPGARRLTEPGHPLRLAEVREVLSRDGNVSFHPQASGTVEGIWGPNGLECLSHPRLENLQPGIWDDIAANCPLIPPCDDRATVVANDMSKNLLDASTPVITFNLSDDSCQGGCGSASAGACSCALGCAASGTCCDDYADVCSPLPAAPSCAHDECIQGATLTSACDPCVTSICAVDPYCCSTYWDSICVGEVSSVCGGACP